MRGIHDICVKRIGQRMKIQRPLLWSIRQSGPCVRVCNRSDRLFGPPGQSDGSQSCQKFPTVRYPDTAVLPALLTARFFFFHRFTPSAERLCRSVVKITRKLTSQATTTPKSLPDFPGRQEVNLENKLKTKNSHVILLSKSARPLS